MTNRRNEIKKKDIESYEIVIPFFDFAGKRRKQFLSSELEKLHPCFSDEFAFDSGIKKIGKKGLLADVLVVNKYKLAEYENRRRLSGSGFFVENNAKSLRFPVFLFERPKRFFVSPKWKLTYFSLTGCLLLVICGIVFGIISGKNSLKNDASKIENGLGAEQIEKNIPEMTSEPGSIAAPLSLSEVFFDCLAASDGTISLFEWKVQGFTEKLSASLSGLYPENLERIKEVSGLVQNEKSSAENLSQTAEGSAVIYEQQIPRMKVSYNRKIAQGASSQALGSNSGLDERLSNSEFNKKLRTLITMHEGVLKEEKAPPYHIEFTCLTETAEAAETAEATGSEEAKKMIEEIATLVKENGRQITSVCVNQRIDEKKRSELRIGLSIEDIPFSGFDLNLLSKNIGLFRESSKVVMKQENQKANAVTFQGGGSGSRGRSSSGQKNPGETAGVKIGEIKKSDNSSLVFFKTSEGKIYSKVILN